MTMPCVIPSHDEPPDESTLVWIEPDLAVDLEFFKVVSIDDYDGSAYCYDLTVEDIKRWNLWEYFYEEDFDENGELILP